jgi:hypothetical protein
MSSQINTANDVYQFVDQLKIKLEKRKNLELVKQLDDALCSGSSGLEILGAIQNILVENIGAIESAIAPNELNALNQVISYVNRVYGR